MRAPSTTLSDSPVRRLYPATAANPPAPSTKTIKMDRALNATSGYITIAVSSAISTAFVLLNPIGFGAGSTAGIAGAVSCTSGGGSANNGRPHL